MAAAHGTDKNGRHAYTQHYGRHLDQLRETAFNLLEIGVGGYEDPLEGGRSLRTWKDYFPLANIVGLDFYDKSAMSEDRIKIYQGSQADPKVISKILSDYDSFRVIIDDGSHRSEHVISTLLMLWQYVEPGGWYIIEDLQTSYWPMFGGAFYEKNSPLTSMGYLKSLVDGLNWSEIHQPTYSPTEFDKTLVGMHFYQNLAFLQKGDNTRGSAFVRENRFPGL